MENNDEKQSVTFMKKVENKLNEMEKGASEESKEEFRKHPIKTIINRSVVTIAIIIIILVLINKSSYTIKNDIIKQRINGVPCNDYAYCIAGNSDWQIDKENNIAYVTANYGIDNHPFTLSLSYRDNKKHTVSDKMNFEFKGTSISEINAINEILKSDKYYQEIMDRILSLKDDKVQGDMLEEFALLDAYVKIQKIRQGDYDSDEIYNYDDDEEYNDNENHCFYPEDSYDLYYEDDYDFSNYIDNETDWNNTDFD